MASDWEPYYAKKASEALANGNRAVAEKALRDLGGVRDIASKANFSGQTPKPGKSARDLSSDLSGGKETVKGAIRSGRAEKVINGR